MNRLNDVPDPFMPLDPELVDYCESIERRRRWLRRWRLALAGAALVAVGIVIGRLL